MLFAKLVRNNIRKMSHKIAGMLIFGQRKKCGDFIHVG